MEEQAAGSIQAHMREEGWVVVWELWGVLLCVCDLVWVQRLSV